MLPTAAPRKVFPVSELTREIRTVLEISFDEVWVSGELSNFKRHSSGHIYFTLKDEGAALSAAFFRQANRFMSFFPQDGDAVVVHGRISVYEPRGSYQIIVDRMEPAGEGARKAQLEALKAKFAAEGLFDPARKRPLPAFPRCIGVATSPTGAVIRDILTVTRRRFPNLHILIAPCRVQGDGAAEEVVRAMADLNRDRRADVLIVGRGGGSAEDLWTFNDERVCRAIAASRIPVVSAVGHETDTTLADMVADLRAPTPSAAAELVVSNQAELRGWLGDISERLAVAVGRTVKGAKESWHHLAGRLRDPASRLAEHAQRIDELTARIESAWRWNVQSRGQTIAGLDLRLREQSPRKQLGLRRLTVEQSRSLLVSVMTRRLTDRRALLGREAARLDAMSPLAVLGRGYSIAFGPAGKVLLAAGDVAQGDEIQVRLRTGRIGARVEKVDAE